MPANADDIVSYLLQCGVIDPREVTEGKFSALDLSRRNRNFAVIREGATSYLLKQAFDEDNAAGIAREAAFYQLVQTNDRLARYLPRFYSYDHVAGILVLELLINAQDMKAYCERLGRFPPSIASSLGSAVAALHKLPVPDQGHAIASFAQALPLAFSLGQPSLAAFCEMSMANIELVRVIQTEPGFETLLGALQQEWHADSLIHCDLRWDNCLVTKGPKPGVKLIDWEFVGPGDPCWDLGSLFANYLSMWIFSVPFIGGDMPPERLPELARYQLTAMQPAIGALWLAYRGAMGLDQSSASEWLQRATRYAAARLIEVVYAQLQSSTSLSSYAAFLLQLSLNMLREPDEAALHLLGLEIHKGTET